MPYFQKKSGSVPLRPASEAPDLSKVALAFVFASILVGVVLMVRLQAQVSNIWITTGGNRVDAAVVDFDFKTKSVILEDKTERRTVVPVRELDLSGKRQLFFSGIFQKTLWMKEDKRLLEILRCYAALVFIPFLLLVFGMWLSGILIARRTNPVVAVAATAGASLISLLLMATYFAFSQRSSTGGSGILWFGSAMSLAVAGLFVSAIYNTTFFRGVIMVFCQIALVALAMDLLVSQAEAYFPSVTRQFWYQSVFFPSGMVDAEQELFSP